MSSHNNTYNRDVLLGASRMRLEDAETLYNAERWSGAMYLSGYAIECSLKSLICYEEGKHNLKHTTISSTSGKMLHNLGFLLACLPQIEREITIDIRRKESGSYSKNWATITKYWNTNQLRYHDQQGNKEECKELLEAVKSLYRYFESKIQSKQSTRRKTKWSLKRKNTPKRS